MCGYDGAALPLNPMTTNWSFGRRMVVIASLCGYGQSPSVCAEETKDPDGPPPIFSLSSSGGRSSAPEAKALAPATHGRGTPDAMFLRILEGLPRFVAGTPGRDASPGESPSASAVGMPVLMEPFTVRGARLPQMEEPRGSRFERMIDTGSVSRRKGREFSSELTFLDLARESNWEPFSLQPPQAATLRLTFSW